jgi:fatty acid desaturase
MKSLKLFLIAIVLLALFIAGLCFSFIFIGASSLFYLITLPLILCPIIAFGVTVGLDMHDLNKEIRHNKKR